MSYKFDVIESESGMEQFPDYIVTVTGNYVDGTSCSIQGLLDTSEMSYSASMSGSSIMNMLGSKSEELLGKVGNIIGSLFNFATTGNTQSGLGGAVSSVAGSFKSIWSTYLGYDSSDPTTFNIDMHIFGSSDKYRNVLEQALKMVLPKLEQSIMTSYLYDTKSLVNSFINSVGNGDGLNGLDPYRGQLINVQIGDWFLATELFCTSVNWGFPTIVNTDGVPIYMTLQLSFSSHKTLTPDELLTWFKF